MITIICNIIVMTITVESSAVGGGIEYHQSPPIHSESLTRSKTVSFAETRWCKAISMSVVEMYFLIEMYRFHGSNIKALEFDFCLLMGLKNNGQRNFICFCVSYAFCTFHFDRVGWFGNFIIKSPVTTDPVISVFHMASTVIWCMASDFIT